MRAGAQQEALLALLEYVGNVAERATESENRSGSAAREFERSVTTLGLRGLKLSPVYHGFDPWSPPVWRLYEMADAFRVPVMFHMGGAYDPEAALEWGSPLLLDRVGRAFPRLRMIVAHLGQPMIGIWDWVGMGACVALAVGGLLLGAWGMSRRDVSR